MTLEWKNDLAYVCKIDYFDGAFGKLMRFEVPNRRRQIEILVRIRSAIMVDSDSNDGFRVDDRDFDI